MRERYLSKSQNGSITVFLTLMLLIMMSFVFTSIEAARITAAQSYLAMLSEMASDSLQGTYYYPLFSEYGLLAVDGGYGDTELSEEKVREFLNDLLEYSTDKTWRGLITADDPNTEIKSIRTLLTSDDCAFSDQIRQEAIFEGVDLLLSGFNDKTLLYASSDISKLIDKQEDAMKAAAEVSKEVLKLMMYVDGVKTGENGLIAGGKGELQTTGSFLKMLGVNDPSYMSSTYGSIRVYDAVSSNIYYPHIVGERILMELDRYEKLSEQIKEAKAQITSLERRCEALKTELANMDINVEGDERIMVEVRIEELGSEIRNIQSTLEDERPKLKEYEREIDTVKESITKAYDSIRDLLNNAEELIETAAESVTDLSKKQKTAKELSYEYETAANALSGEYGGILGGFEDEAEGLDDSLEKKDLGYDTGVMIQTLKNNRQWLRNCKMPVLDISNPSKVRKDVQDVINAMGNIHYDGFTFKYGTIRLNHTTGQDIKKVISDLLGSGILGVIGVNNVSQSEITGEDLVSGGAWNSVAADVWAAFEEMRKMFESTDIGEVIDSAVRGLTDDLMTEVYLKNNFSLYTKQRDNTKLKYEREYVLFGYPTDASNLNAMALRLMGFRTVFTFAALMADSARVGQAEALGELVAGLTGIGPLLYVVKYAILTAWALEEALIEVCALFKGKAVKLYEAHGRVSIDELFTMTTMNIERKAEGINDLGGAKYSDYVTVLSFFENRKRKNYRMMDLIQENIRFRFRDPFRIRNCITNVDFEMSYAFIRKFDTGFFGRDVYDMTYAAKMDYVD